MWEYKWTDKDGNVHFGDKPEGFEAVERLDIESKPTDPERVQAELQALSPPADADDSDDDDEEEASLEPDPQAEARERAERCTDSRSSMQDLSNARRMYREDEAGERTYLSEEEMQAARQRVADQVDEFCDT